ncbi:MAG: leucyl aminopeptidase [Gemmatimonadaceae bacterium]|nr:leucyl aminopeptidase [Gemmatimonadaceae bacterium]
MSLRANVRRGLSGVDTPLLAVLLNAGAPLPSVLATLDRRFGGAIGAALAAGDFKGKRDETLLLRGPAGRGVQRVLLVGVGTIGDDFDAYNATVRASAIAGRKANASGVQAVALWAPILEGELVEAAVIGTAHGAWHFTEMQTMPPVKERPKPLRDITVCATSNSGAVEALAAGIAIAEGQAVARRLQVLPGNVCTPEHIARVAREVARANRMKITVLGRRELIKLRMGSFLAVAQGTPQDPKLIAMEYRGGARGAKPLVLVGKGLCFDSGGISIKPADRMELMKYDMSGAAGVVGAMHAIAALGLPLNVVGLIGSTTNMPSGTAMNPGDVVRASNGKTIEIINTDAEGRLVLADVLSYAARYKPAAVIDAATLTGAVVVALGNTTTGVMGNDQALVDQVRAAQARAGEPGWQLPMSPEYNDLIKSDIADIKNSGGRAAGTITAALFLREFVDYPWVHLDIAGTAYSESDLVVSPRGPTGLPVRTFVEIARGRAR